MQTVQWRDHLKTYDMGYGIDLQNHCFQVETNPIANPRLLLLYLTNKNRIK